MLKIGTLVVILGALAALTAFWGCSKALKTCTVSPVDIEESRADTRDLDVGLAKLQKELAGVQAQLDQWETKVAERRSTVPQLRGELVRLKKKSGMTEKLEEQAAAHAATGR